MRISGKGFLALRTSVIVGFVVFWNAMFFLAIRYNGQFGKIEDPRAASLVGVTNLAAFAFALTVIVSRRARRVLFSPKRAHLYAPDPFFLICLLCFVLALSSFAIATGITDSSCQLQV